MIHTHIFTRDLQPQQMLAMAVAVFLLGAIMPLFLRAARRKAEPIGVGVIAFATGQVYRVTMGLTSEQGFNRYAFAQFPYGIVQKQSSQVGRHPINWRDEGTRRD